jgi:D-proline reductase (dithiol)-stabilizing protein PrdE
MGIGPSTKETSLHHFRDPLVDIVSQDEGIDLMGVLLFGTADDNVDKIRNSTRAAIVAECMRADGVIVSSDGWGNSDVDYVNCVKELGERDIPLSGLNFSGTMATFVVEDPNLKNIVDICKNPDGVESNIVGENNMVAEDVKKALMILKIRMREKEMRNRK